MRKAISFGTRLQQIRTIRQRREAKVDAWDLERFQDALDDLAPDLTRLDIELPIHVMSAGSPDLTLAVWRPLMALGKHRGLPPLNSSTIPSKGRPGRSISAELEWLTFRSSRWLATQRDRITWIGKDQLLVIRITAAEIGVALRTETSRYQSFKPIVFCSLPLLILSPVVEPMGKNQTWVGQSGTGSSR